MRLILIMLVMLCSACVRHQPMHLENDAEAVIQKIVSVYDADTFRVALKDWPEYLGDDIGIRVRGIDAPEIRGQCEAEKRKARKARDYVKRLLLQASIVTLENIEPDKYFRLLADVYIDGQLLSDILLESGYARVYAGGKRENWCTQSAP